MEANKTAADFLWEAANDPNHQRVEAEELRLRRKALFQRDVITLRGATIVAKGLKIKNATIYVDSIVFPNAIPNG